MEGDGLGAETNLNVLPLWPAPLQNSRQKHWLSLHLSFPSRGQVETTYLLGYEEYEYKED